MSLNGFISALELRNSLTDYIIVDCEPKHAYKRFHIPGAHNSPCRYWKGEGSDQGLLAISDVKLLAPLVASWGLNEDSRLVAYDHSGGLYAARLCWTLERFGFMKSYVLDGGLQAWYEEGLSLTQEVPGSQVSTFQFSTAHDNNLAHLSGIESALQSESTILWDNRSALEWQGGRIPGGRHLEWSDLNDSKGRLLNEKQLRSQFSRLGLKPDVPTVVYCLAGVRAAHGYWVLKSLGHQSVKVYDGSWAEYEKSGLSILKDEI